MHGDAALRKRAERVIPGGMPPPGPRGGRRGLVVFRLALEHMRVPLLDRQFSLPSVGEALAGETLRDAGAAAEFDRLVADLLAPAGAI